MRSLKIELPALSVQVYVVTLPIFCIWFVTAAPHLTEKPPDAHKTIDETLVWECKASAKPKPSYRWLKNGEPLDLTEVRDFFQILIWMHLILLSSARPQVPTR